MAKYNGLSDNIKPNKFYEIENIQNAKLVELQEINETRDDELALYLMYF